MTAENTLSSAKAKVRKIVTFVEETHSEMDRTVAPPTRRAAAAAVIENPFAGRYVEDLSMLMSIGEQLGELLAGRAVAALGISGNNVESYGKAAAVGENGELEHAAAILHPKLGTPVRRTLGKGAALIPSSKKRGGMGVAIDIPLGHKDAAFVRSHFDGMEIRRCTACERNRCGHRRHGQRPSACTRWRSDQRSNQGR
jgi:hypothetical protein